MSGSLGVAEVARQRSLQLAAALVLGSAAVSLAACATPPSVPGTVGGILPACYGPGVDMNLTPSRVVEVYQDGMLVKRQSFRSDKHHTEYKFELSPGTYDVKGPGIAAIHAQVKSGEHTTVDLPIPPCL